MSVPGDTVAVARALAALDRAALGTLDAAGAPYVSLVLVALDARRFPLLYLSDLAEHTKNIKRNPRASLLLDGTAGMPEPLAGPRLTLMGAVEAADEPAMLPRFIARHPEAAGWKELPDFRLYRLVPERAHLVAGFGRIAWIEAAALFSGTG